MAALVRRGLLGLLLASTSATACLSVAAKQSAADKAYLGEHMHCVDKYKTRDEILACREGVRMRWDASDHD